MSKQQSLYKILELSDEASIADIKKAYRRLSFKYHPDTNKGKKSTVDKFIQIDNAYNILSDPIKKAEYDRLLKNAQRQKPVSKKQHKPQYSKQRSYETDSETDSEEDWRDWRSLKNQHPVISMIICYIAIVILLIYMLLPNNKKKRSDNIFTQHTQYIHNTQNEEEYLATVRDIINDRDEKKYESIDYPFVIENSMPQLWLYNVELTGSETILSFMYINPDKKPITISDDIHLVARMSENNSLITQEYNLLRKDSIPLSTEKHGSVQADSLFFFRLVFDAIPNAFRYFNLIESERDKKSFFRLSVNLSQTDIRTQHKFKEMGIKKL